jgi:hypothetical protein
MTDTSNSSKDRYTFTQWLIVVATILIGGYLFAASTWRVDTPLIGGRARLMLNNATLKLHMQTTFRLLELHFLDDISMARKPELSRTSSGPSEENLKSDVVVNVSSRVISVQALNGKSIAPETDLYVWFADARDGMPVSRFITNVKLDDRYVGLKDFLTLNLDQNSSNVSYYKPLDIYNISHTLANGLGLALTLGVTYFLLLMFGVQVFVLFTAFVRQYIPSLYGEVGLAAKTPLRYMDAFAEKYATFFGFLGTVSSLWAGLEKTDQYDSFFQILALVKFAVFTTVLGLLIKLIYELRKYLHDHYYVGKS